MCAESDRSDQTQQGSGFSCNDDDVSEDAGLDDEGELHSEDEDDASQQDPHELAQSDDDSGADGVSSGISFSDCESPAMGLSAFDGPLQSTRESIDERSAYVKTDSFL